MRAALWSCVALLAVARAAGTADSDGDDLLRKVRAKVLDDIGRMPRYTCVQTVDRAQYLPLYEKKPESCAEMIAARKQLMSPGHLVWRDRIRLDVAVLDGEETFSWAGARQFDTTHVDEIVVSGALGTGEFASFLTSVFAGEADVISFKGPSLFSFDMPFVRSHFTFHSRGGPSRTTGYHGSFRVDPETAELKRLTILADQFSTDDSTCRLQDAMDYHRVKMGNGDFPLPAIATMDILYKNGSESMNETRYSDCREYSGESTIRYGVDAGAPRTGQPESAATRRAAERPLPTRLRFRIALQSPIRSETAAAGDAVTGVVLADVRGPAGGLVAHENDLVHGRILQLEQFTDPSPRWILSIRFDTLEHDGIEQSIVLQSPIGDAFTFRQAENLELDENFRTDWETR